LLAGVDHERKVPVTSEFETIGPEPVESLTITTLVDNVTDILLLDEGRRTRGSYAGRGYLRMAGSGFARSVSAARPEG
jgi:hypothetical protein